MIVRSFSTSAFLAAKCDDNTYACCETDGMICDTAANGCSVATPPVSAGKIFKRLKASPSAMPVCVPHRSLATFLWPRLSGRLCYVSVCSATAPLSRAMTKTTFPLVINAAQLGTSATMPLMGRTTAFPVLPAKVSHPRRARFGPCGLPASTTSLPLARAPYAVVCHAHGSNYDEWVCCSGDQQCGPVPGEPGNVDCVCTDAQFAACLAVNGASNACKATSSSTNGYVCAVSYAHSMQNSIQGQLPRCLSLVMPSLVSQKCTADRAACLETAGYICDNNGCVLP